jgi:hypothetical protein
LHEKSHSHLHLTLTDETAWGDLMPRRLLHDDSNNPQVHNAEEFNWLMLYR